MWLHSSLCCSQFLFDISTRGYQNICQASACQPQLRTFGSHKTIKLHSRLAEELTPEFWWAGDCLGKGHLRLPLLLGR